MSATGANGQKPKRVVAIVGKSPITREMANLEPPDVEIWGLNDDFDFLRRWDRWFEIHPRTENGSYGYEGEEMEKRAFNFFWDCGVPIFMAEADSRLPNSRAFPFQEIGSRYRFYWTSTIAYMLSMAVYEQVDEIHLWGVDMASASEYMDQRPCCEYWLGVAQGQGATVAVPESSPLLKGRGGTYPFVGERFVTAATIRDELVRLEAQMKTRADNLLGQPASVLSAEMRPYRAARTRLRHLLDIAAPETRGKPLHSIVLGVAKDPLGMVEVLASE